MLETSPVRKNKVNLTDYNCELDIANRMLMADFSTFDVEVLEELLYSPLKTSAKKLCRNLNCSEEELLPVLKKLSSTGLLSFQEDTVLIDKESRKYFEFQIERFHPDFKPDMEFVQGLLRKVPIHLLTTWYLVPRTSNNIFESLVERYLLTPHIFQRYLMDLHFADPLAQRIIQEVFHSPQLRISSSDLIAKYNLTRRNFEEITLLLEFNFVCCLTYEKVDDHWVEYVSPFYEWQQYLRFLKTTEAAPLSPEAPLVRCREGDFSFVQDMALILQTAKKNPISLADWHEGMPVLPVPLACEFAAICSIPVETAQDLQFAQTYFAHLLQKICLVKLASRVDGRLYALDTSHDWLEMGLENQALFLYRHPLNHILSHSLPVHLATDRNIREAEKSIKRVLHGNWVYFDEFIQGVLVPLNEDSVVLLKKTGKTWKYTLPSYTDEEKALIKATIFEWLFEAGMVAIGTSEGRDCFAVTSFGRFFFEA